jgi:hypothetical protein
MDKRRRHKIIKQLKSILKKAGNLEVNRDWKAVLEETVRNPLRLLDLDDEFPFDSTKCITECGGRCCFRTRVVRVGPVDADYLAKSPSLEGMGREEIVDRFFSIFLGGTGGSREEESASLLPMGVLKRIEVVGHYICPFIDLKIRKKYRENADPFLGGVGGICKLGQGYKPAICMLYPLGRLETAVEPGDDEREREEEDQDFEEPFFVLITDDCAAVKTAKRISVRDFTAAYRRRKEDSDLWRKGVTREIVRLRRAVGFQRAKEIMTGFLDYFFKSSDSMREKLERVRRRVDEEVGAASE